MSSKLPHPEPGHVCGHPDCCPPEPLAPESIPPPYGQALLNRAEEGKAAVSGAFKRWLLWFLAFFGIYASSSMCPFCGTPGCPVGAGAALVVGGVFAALWQYGRNVWEIFKRMVARRGR
jgi:hypothetical protein